MKKEIKQQVVKQLRIDLARRRDEFFKAKTEKANIVKEIKKCKQGIFNAERIKNSPDILMFIQSFKSTIGSCNNEISLMKRKHNCLKVKLEMVEEKISSIKKDLSQRIILLRQIK